MKKFFLASMLACSFFLSNGQNGTIDLNVKGARQECTSTSSKSFEASFVFDEIQSAPISTEKGQFSQLLIPNTFPTGTVGTPQLPAARKLIAIPQGATPRVVVKNFTETEYQLSDFDIQTVYPNQPSLRKDVKPEDAPFIYSAEAYNTKGFEERPVAQVEYMGTMRGMSIGSLTVNPVIYNASTNTIIVRNNIDVEVVFDNADLDATQKLYESTYSIYFEPVYKQMFNAKDDVYSEHPDLYNTPVHMMVVAPDDWMETLQPWLEWKTMKGFYVDVYPTSVAGSNYNTIQSFIHGKYAEGVEQGETPTFLVLVGDEPQIPGTTGSSSHEVTDLYYSSVDGDYFPDMYCSRMCVSNTSELAALINKILVYEKLECDPSYLSKALLVAGVDSYWNPIVGQPAINYADTYRFTEEHGYTDVYKYLNSYSGCYSHLSTGVGFANYTAHGGETSWADPSFTVSNVNSLTNENMYFLAIGNCCVAANWGYSGVCLGEAMIRANNKAAYTYIGSCPNTYWYEDYYWGVGATNVMSQTPTPETSTTGAYDGMNMIDMYNTTNSILFLGNIAVCHAHDGGYGTHSTPTYYWQAYHCLGDGSIMPYNFGVPEANSVSHMDIVPIGVDFYEVTALPGSMVAISKDGVLHGTAVVDETGVVEVPMTPITSGGTATIVVTRPNTAPVIEEMVCAALDGPYLIGEDFTINDANQDGKFDYAEVGTIGYSIKNVGSDPSVNTIATISTEDEFVTFENFTANFGSVPVDEIVTLSDAFTVNVSPVIPNNHIVECVITITDGDDTWIDEIEFQACAPRIILASHGVEGQLLPGETLNLTVTFANTGSADIYNASGVYFTDCEYVTINTTDAVAYGNIPVGSSVSAAFSITVSPDAPFGTIINSTVTLSADNNFVYEGVFEPFIDICNVAISTFPYNEGYEDVELPNCWTQEIVNGDAQWTTNNGGLEHHPYNAHTGDFNAYITGIDSTVVKLVSPLINLSNLSEPTLSFWHAQSVRASKQDKLRVFYKTSIDGEWILLATYNFSLANWREREIALPETSTNFYIAFEAELNGGYGVVVDDVTISGIGGSSVIGDADGNGTVDVLDVVVTVNYVVGDEPANFIFANADVNADGVVNVLDVMAIVNIILNSKSTPVVYDVNAEYYVENDILYVNTPVAFGGVQVELTNGSSAEFMSIANLMTAEGNNTFVAYNMRAESVAAGVYPICKLNGAQVSNVILSDAFANNINVLDGGILGVEENANMTLPYPNPFTGSLNIAYNVNEANSNVEIVISNVNGQIIDRLTADNMTSGSFETTWTPNSDVKSGVYFISLNVNGQNIQVSKVVYNK